MKKAGETTVTGKNQITLPAEAVRTLGWKKGDRLIVDVMNEDIVLLIRRPEDWAEFSAKHLSDLWGTHEENMAYLEEL